MTKKDLVRLLAEIYEEEGPGGSGGKKVPPKEFAALTSQQVDEKWDFSHRHLMHRVAYAISQS